MAGTNNMPKAFYPPRARWYSPIFYFWYWLRRRLLLDRIKLPSAVNLVRVLLGLMLPGYAFAACGRPTIARVVYGGYALAACTFIVWLGYVISSLALAAMVSLHVVGVLYLVGRHSPELNGRWRMVLSVTTFLLVYFCFYSPLRRQFEERLAMPLRVGDKVVMVSSRKDAGTVRRGDWVAYRIVPIREGNAFLAGGLGFGRVQAVAGDEVVFTPKSLQINGVLFPRRRYMPVNQTWVVPEKHWFIWPDSTISISGNQEQGDAVARLMCGLSLVAEPQYVGQPLRRWFWRRQTMP